MATNEVDAAAHIGRLRLQLLAQARRIAALQGVMKVAIERLDGAAELDRSALAIVMLEVLAQPIETEDEVWERAGKAMVERDQQRKADRN